jgi:hypothetical protein
MPSGLEGPTGRARQPTFPAWEEFVHEPPDEDIANYYLTVLLAIAILLAAIQEHSDLKSGRR